MKAVQVQYTVRPDYAEQNRANIRRVMKRLRADPIDGMLYASFTLDDGCTFVHINLARDADTLARIQEVEEFRAFQAALRESSPPSPPAVTNLDPVDLGFSL